MPLYDIAYNPTPPTLNWRLPVPPPIVPNSAPPDDLTRWEALSPSVWSDIAGYALGTRVSRVVGGNERLYISNTSIAAITGAVQADWRATAAAVSGSARYNHTAGHLVVNDTANAGSFPADTSGTWRIRQGANPAPPNANYTTLVTPAHDPQAAYNIGDYSVSGGLLYRATAAIPAPTNTWQPQTSSNISLGAGQWEGAFTTATRLYFIDDVANYARAYDLNGVRLSSSADISISGGNVRGGVATSTRIFFVLPGTARAYDLNGVRQSASDIDFPSSWGVNGGAATATRLYFVDGQNDFARAYDHSGNRQSADDISLGTGAWNGGFATSTHLYFIDREGSVHAYDHSGNRQAAADISLGSGRWRGGAATPTRLYFIDFDTDTAHAYSLQSTPNSAPASDTARWTQVATSAWSDLAAVPANAVRVFLGVYYRANVNIPSGTGKEADGALTVINHSGGNRDIRVGSEAAFRAAFGNVAITSGGNFELVKLTNAAPEDAAAAWSQVVVTAWNQFAAYNLNAIVTQGSPAVYYRARVNIAAVNPNQENDYRLRYADGALSWVRRASLLTNAVVLSYNTDTSAFEWRGALQQNALLTTAGEALQTESGLNLETG